MQPSDSAADPFLRLPTDLISHLASLIPIRPRLLVLAVLNKRWHACVFKSITSLGELEHNFPPERVASIPSITEWSVSRKFSEAALPTTLQALTFIRSAEWTPSATHHLASLTRLVCWDNAPAGFVPKYATALAELHLMNAKLNEELVRHYPRLTSLYLQEVGKLADIGNLIALHATQLTHLDLSLKATGPPDIPALRPLTRLRTFKFFGVCAWLPGLVKLLPRDCKLNYACVDGTLTEEDCPFVTDLCLYHMPHPPDMLTRCSSLAALDLDDSAEAAVDIRALSSSMRSLKLDGCNKLLAQDWSHLRCLTKFKALRLPPSLPTAHLRKLTVDWQPYIASERGLASLCDVICACPKLEKLGSLPMPPADLDIDALARLAHVAGTRGVTKLSVHLTYIMVSHDEKEEEYERKSEAIEALARSLPWLELKVHGNSLYANMPSLAVKTLKEVLYLNKGMVYSGMLWGGIISVLGGVKSLQSQCAVLTGLSWFGLILGFGASLADLVLEVLQDWAYTAPFGTDATVHQVLQELERQCRAQGDNDATTRVKVTRARYDLLRQVPLDEKDAD